MEYFEVDTTVKTVYKLFYQNVHKEPGELLDNKSGLLFSFLSSSYFDYIFSDSLLFHQQTLQVAAKKMPASCVDLFGLDPKLLEALMPFQHEGVW